MEFCKFDFGCAEIGWSPSEKYLLCRPEIQQSSEIVIVSKIFGSTTTRHVRFQMDFWVDKLINQILEIRSMTMTSWHFKILRRGCGQAYRTSA
jgi:hypothetical protein